MSTTEVLRNFGSYWMEIDVPGPEAASTFYYPADGIGGVTTNINNSMLAGGASRATIIEAISIAVPAAGLGLITFRDADISLGLSFATGTGATPKNIYMPLGNGYKIQGSSSGNFSVRVTTASKIFIFFNILH